jgi:7-cyano-7-deazaguanine synthase
MELLLRSGGLESTALAAWRRPSLTLTIDYGQRPAAGEVAAAAAVCRELGLPHHVLRVDCAALGAGLLAARAPVPDGPSPEWWPYRNQLLATLAAGWGLPRGATAVAVGSVATDGQRHIDGTAEFYVALDAVVAMQEGGMRVEVPAIAMTSEELIERSGVSDDVLGWTHSCHRADLACGACPGCAKRREVLSRLGRLQ